MLLAILGAADEIPLGSAEFRIVLRKLVGCGYCGPKFEEDGCLGERMRCRRSSRLKMVGHHGKRLQRAKFVVGWHRRLLDAALQNTEQLPKFDVVHRQ